MSALAVLVGAPGAGKTTVGRRLAEHLGCSFTDTDALVEEESGMSVSDIFVTLGEPAFREREEDAVARALGGDGVVALGGGAVMSPATRDRLREQPVIWLRVDLSSAASRVGMNTARPLLLGNVRTKMATLLQDRAPLYEEVATAVVDTSGRKVRDVVADVVTIVDGWRAND